MSTQALTGILEMPPGRIVSGTAKLPRRRPDRLDARDRRRIVGDRITMVFQDSLSALNPVQSVGRQIAECYQVHRGTVQARRDGVGRTRCSTRCGSRRRGERVNDYPHEFSGGMRQRVMLAMALALDPDVLIADEPTTALDVTVQAQILELIAELQAERHMGVVLITHDLGVVADVADNVVVMYAGRVVERAATADALDHPCTRTPRACSRSMPSAELKGRELPAIPGTPPVAARRARPGCAFRTRCPLAIDECAVTVPPLLPSRPAVKPRASAVHGADTREAGR